MTFVVCFIIFEIEITNTIWVDTFPVLASILSHRYTFNIANCFELSVKWAQL